MTTTDAEEKEKRDAVRMAEDAGLIQKPFGEGAAIADLRLLRRIERIEAYLGIAFIADDLRAKDTQKP